MGALLDVIVPVFLVIGAGYLVVWRGLFSDEAADGLMIFTQKFALPCLLFRAMSTLDLGQNFSLALLGSFYIGAVGGFIAGIAGARLLFGRPWEDSIAIGFCCLFSNSLLLGVPITERAYGPDALEANFAIIALHSPFCYALGITVMEVVRARATGRRLTRLAGPVLKAVFSNGLVLGITLGIVVNLLALTMPAPVDAAVDLMVRAALPTALFGLGGILVRYRPEGDLRTIAFAVAVSLLLHPAITFGIGRATGLPVDDMRSAVVTAAMPPGVNAYIFANMYGVAKRVVASTVLISTALAVITGWGWLTLLP